MSHDKKKIAYIMSRFPHLPETFILREMMAIEEHGWDVVLYPLIIQKQPVIHQDAQMWIARAKKIPWFSVKLLIDVIINPNRYFQLWGKTIWGNISYLNFLLRSLVIFPKALMMAVQIKADGVVHIHAHYATHPALAAWLIHQLTGIPYSITAHAHDIFVNQTMMKQKMQDAAFIVAISEYNARFIAQHLGEWVIPKIHVLHCGIDPEKYEFSKSERNSQEPFQIVSIGSLQPYKGQRYLVEACKLLKNRGINFHCTIIGGGELKEELSLLIEQLGLGNIVELTGPLPQEAVAQILRKMDCYIQPSIITASGKMEGIPVALMEALACELPAVATNISGIPELVRDGETGWLVPQKDAGRLADAIESVYTDFPEAKKRAQAGRALVVNEYNILKVTTQLSDLFQKTAGIE